MEKVSLQVKKPQLTDETGSTHEMSKSTRRLSQYGKKVATRKGRTYPLRSSFSSSRVLRSNSKPTSKSPLPSSNGPVNIVKVKGKKRRKAQSETADVFLKTRKSVRYLLHRMSYEQNLIEAYAGEGWRGQSLEKIRPEKELQRAKSEIIRCKLKIRSCFQQLDGLISEGKLDESLFDSEGEIGSEDIFCAKCKSTDVSENNDIILCDGICDRGFHQKCLNPPLSTEDIPDDDEGWLCPACDCKVDCIDLINEQQGTNFLIEGEWEKIFPEVAVFASSDGQYDNLELPSDDSEDHDYNPSDLEAENLEADGESSKESSSDESDSSSLSDDLGSPNHDTHDQNVGLPSDDSEDGDFDPDQPEVDEDSSKDSQKSDESDFSSDTDDLDNLSHEASDGNEASTHPVTKQPRISGGSDACLLHPSESDLGEESVEILSGKRQRGHLDYKKLYDEAYGNKLSDSSDDEEWRASRPAKLTSVANGIAIQELTQSGSKRKKKPGRDQVATVSLENNIIRKEKTCSKIKASVEDYSAAGRKPDSSSSSHSKFGAAVYQKLQESFDQNQYPGREAKEALARELGMTLRQVGKWFENTRHKHNVSAGEVCTARSSGAHKSGRNFKEAAASKSSGKGGRKDKVAEEQSTSLHMPHTPELRKRRVSK